MPHRSALLVIAVLAMLAYLPALKLSFIADDFPQIQMSRTLENPGGFQGLMTSPIANTRITFFVLTYFVDRVAGLNPQVFHAVALGLHVLACWLVYALGVWRLIDRRVAMIAACFFAIFEGHQEAVMWYSAVMETLLFIFGIGALVCFIQWLNGKGWIWYGLAVIGFILALFSKESGYIFPVLMALPLIEMKSRSKAIGLIPFVLLAIVYVGWIAAGRFENPRFGDGSFVLSPHAIVVIGESFGRLLFIWGLLALIALALLKARDYLPLTVYSLIWMLIALVPYSFLTYLNRVPSRHTYLASVGLALIVAAALACIWENLGGRFVLVVAAAILMTNVGILWKKKVDQYRTRALPTDMLINAVRRADGPVHIRCYPYIPLVAESAAREFGGIVVFEKDEQQNKNNGRCLNYWYKDATGAVREVFVPPARLP